MKDGNGRQIERKHIIVTMLIAIVIVFLMMPTQAFADTKSQDGVQVDVVTDHAQYAAGDTVEITVTVTNNNTAAVTNINLTQTPPSGLVFKEGDGTITIDSLASEDSQEYIFYLVQAIDTYNPGNTGTTGSGVPATGDTGLSWIIMVGLIASAVVFAFGVRTLKGRKKSRVTALILSLVLISGLVAVVPATETFAATRNGFPVDVDFTYAGATKTHVVNVSYDLTAVTSSTSIILVFDAAGPAVIYNQWKDAQVLYSLDGTDAIPLPDNGTPVNIEVSNGSTLELTEAVSGVSFRNWAAELDSGYNYNPLVAGIPAHIAAFPSMNAFTTDDTGEEAGNDFFAYFNTLGSLTSLPSGSFDTSNIITVGNDFFLCFNFYGNIEHLPPYSFDTSSISIVGNGFFYGFNAGGALTGSTGLPAGSFDTSNISTVGNGFFAVFNGEGGGLTGLPDGSFKLSNISTADDSFFLGFNGNGALEKLPAGSFDTSGITTVGGYFFASFNKSGALSSLPAGSFDTSHIVAAGSDPDYFFYEFNNSGKLSNKGSSNPKNITGNPIDAYYWETDTSETAVPVISGDYFGYV
jgi:uncharacterized repeat protein (TIGR01451 family)